MSGDADSAVVIPRRIEDAVRDTAFARLAAEDDTRVVLARGEKLPEVSRRSGVLRPASALRLHAKAAHDDGRAPPGPMRRDR